MIDNQHTAAGLAQATQQGNEIVSLALTESGSRLIEQQERGAAARQLGKIAPATAGLK
jgi:hypothetical protein